MRVQGADRDKPEQQEYTEEQKLKDQVEALYIVPFYLVMIAWIIKALGHW